MNRNKKTLYFWVLVAAPVICPNILSFTFLFLFCDFCERGDSWYSEGKFWFSFTLKVSFGFPSIFGFERNWEEDFLTQESEEEEYGNLENSEEEKKGEGKGRE